MEKLMEIARKAADRVEVYSRDTRSDDVSFENAKLKDIGSSISSGIGLTLIKDGKLGTAYTRNLTDREGLVENALTAMKGGVEADYAMAGKAELPKLDGYDESIEKLSNTKMTEEVERVCETLSGRATGQVNAGVERSVTTVRVLTSEGADFSARTSGYQCYFAVMYPGSYSSIARLVAGKGFVPASDEDLSYVADTYNASLKEVTPETGRTRVLFLPETVYGLAWRVMLGTRGKEVYENVSPLKDKVGKKIAGEQFSLVDEPLNDVWPGARAFDDEGTPCRDTPVVENGVLKGFYYDRYYARKAGVEPTGHGWRQDVTTRTGPSLHHMAIKPGEDTLKDLLGKMDRGVVAAGLLGAHSGNLLHGDFSMGLAPALWVEKGEVVGHVKDAMVAGNVYEDLNNVVAVGSRQRLYYMGRFPALLLDGVSFATKG